MIDALLSAVLNVVVLAGIPFLFYSGYHKWRRHRGLGEAARRAGLQVGDKRHLLYSVGFALASALALVVWSPPLEPMLREGSAAREFAGLGFSLPTLVMALLYGVIKTGFSEEFLFRGLIAGSLGRRLPFLWANLLQAAIFLAPHLLLLLVAPELWFILPLVFVAGLVLGWLRIESGSILGPWLVHATVNVVMMLSVALRTAPPS